MRTGLLPGCWRPATTPSRRRAAPSWPPASTNLPSALRSTAAAVCPVRSRAVPGHVALTPTRGDNSVSVRQASSTDAARSQPGASLACSNRVRASRNRPSAMACSASRTSAVTRARTCDNSACGVGRHTWNGLAYGSAGDAHTRMTPSRSPVTATSPVRHRPLNVWRQRPVSSSHTRTVESLPSDTARRPSALVASAAT